MKKAGVLLEQWKLPIFRKHLDAAGYSYTELTFDNDNLMLMTVDFEWVSDLLPVLEAAKTECGHAPESET